MITIAGKPTRFAQKGLIVPFRFYRRVRIAPDLRVNLSKSGMSLARAALNSRSAQASGLFMAQTYHGQRRPKFGLTIPSAAPSAESASSRPASLSMFMRWKSVIAPHIRRASDAVNSRRSVERTG
jgi:hypothetical protein